MNRPGPRLYSGTLANVGPVYQTLIVNSPAVPPESGWISQIIASITAGPGTKLKVKIEDVPGSGHDLEYDDPDVPGDPVEAPINFVDPRVFYEGKITFPVLVYADVAGTDVKVEIVVETL